MPKLGVAGAALLVVCLPAAVHAEEYVPKPLTPIPDGPDHITPLKKGEPAPEDGFLYDRSTALRWGNYLGQCTLRLREDVVEERRVTKSQADYYNAVLKFEKDKYTVVTDDYRRRIEKLEYEANHPSFFKSGWFYFSVGVVATGAVVGFTAWSLGQAR